MNDEQLINGVQQNILRNHALEISREEAMQAIQAVVLTLAENLEAGEAKWFVGALPADISGSLGQVEAAESFTREGFFGAVAERTDEDTVRAAYYVRAVFAALQEVLTAEQMERLRAHLPEMFGPVFDSFSGATVQPPPAHERAQEVGEEAERSGGVKRDA
jgi:uncharacterized protein (DUF2267 family)